MKWERVAPLLSEHGLAGLHGSSPDVGIAGYSLGGGMGWLARRYGLQTNSVTAIELVLGDGRHVRTDATHEPDLFWALRGGNGNFGVVTAIEFAVSPLEELYAGTMFFPFERSGEVCLVALGVTPDAESVDPVHAAVARLESAMLPWRAGDYPNFIERPVDTSRFFDPATWQRLRDVKTQYDPDDVLRGNHRIPPAERPTAERQAA